MALEDKIYALRDQAKAEGREPVPDNYQGVTKHRIQSVSAFDAMLLPGQTMDGTA